MLYLYRDIFTRKFNVIDTIDTYVYYNMYIRSVQNKTLNAKIIL